MKNHNIAFKTILVVLACYAFSPKTWAVSPAPVGGYPGENTATGQNALLTLSTGTFNTAVGWSSLKSLTGGNFNTAEGTAARGKKCDAIEGIIDEGEEIMEEYAGTPALDAGLLAAAQAVEHYEISRYGTLKAWARKLNMPEAIKLLDQTLTEEKKTDETLSKIAETAVNYKAAA